MSQSDGGVIENERNRQSVREQEGTISRERSRENERERERATRSTMAAERVAGVAVVMVAGVLAAAAGDGGIGRR